MKLIFEQKILDHDMTRLLAKKMYNDFLSQTENFTLFLEGGLGAGKTFLVREILRHFGVEGDVTSPTYILVNEYVPKKNPADTSHAHFDFYRIEDHREFFNRGFDEIAEDKTVSKFVEWGERLPPEIRNSFSGDHFVIKIKHGVSVGERSVKVLQGM